MERLTKRVGYRSEAAPLEDMDDALALQRVIDRLAAYEDTGLEPDEILDPVEMAKVAMALKENSRLRSQLAEQDKEIERLREAHKKEVVVTGEYAQRAIDLESENASLREQLAEVVEENDKLRYAITNPDEYIGYQSNLIDRLQRERDAAVSDMKYGIDHIGCEVCKKGQNASECNGNGCDFEWRGLRKEG